MELQRHYKTIIVGAGMAGIGCARTLAEKGNGDFLVITKDIGGRVIDSSDHKVNYGAYYIRSDYYNTKKFFKLGRKIRIKLLRFQRGNHSWTFWDVLFQHPFLMMRLYRHLFTFNAHYQKFKKKCEVVSQLEAFEADPYLKDLYHESAIGWFRRNRFDSLIPKIVDPLTKSTAFVEVEDDAMNAAGVLLLLLIALYPTHEFTLELDKFTKGIENKILTNKEVSKIVKERDVWRIILTSGEEFTAENLVVATPINISKELLGLDIPTNRSVSVHMAHVKGVLRFEYKNSGDLILFSSHRNQDLVITHESDGTFLFYSHNPNYNLAKYFENYEVITQKFWHPCFFMGHEITPSCFPGNLFVIGDHNACGMEDAYITGIYAANQISS